MEMTMIWAVAPPLTPGEKVIGSLFASVVVALSLYLIYKHFRPGVPAQSGQAESNAEEPNKPVDPALHSGGFLRISTATLMALCGLMMFFGVWFINPAERPNLFVQYWFIVICVVVALFLLGGFDLLSVRRKAMQERRRILRENQDSLREDLKAYYRSKGTGPGGNGHAHGNGARPKN